MIVSKYDLLWKYVSEKTGESLKLSFDDIARISGAAIDHSFLRYKKELSEYGWQVEKISMKEKTVLFKKI